MERVCDGGVEVFCNSLPQCRGCFDIAEEYHLKVVAQFPLGYLERRAKNATDFARKRNPGINGTIAAEDIRQLLRLQYANCNHCGRDFRQYPDFHIDHRTPVKQGGQNNFSNLQLLCADCNLEKGNRSEEQLEKEEWDVEREEWVAPCPRCKKMKPVHFELCYDCAHPQKRGTDECPECGYEKPVRFELCYDCHEYHYGF